VTKFFIATKGEWNFERAGRWVRVPHGFWLGEYFTPVFRGERLPPGHDSWDAPPSDDYWALLQLAAYLLPRRVTKGIAFQQQWGVSGSRLTPGEMLAQRSEVFTHLHQHYVRCTVEPALFIRKGTGFLVDAPDVLSAAVAEGLLLAALNVRVFFCFRCKQFTGKECPGCRAGKEDRQRFGVWLRKLKQRGKISEVERKKALDILKLHGVARARQKVEEDLRSSGRVRPYTKRNNG